MEKRESTSDNQRPWQSYHTVFTNAKAGMDGVDKEKVQRIVYEMSKGSKFFENEERKEAFIKQKIEHMRDRCAKLTAADLSYYQHVADTKIALLEATRDLSRIWLHVDMDAFYAAVETLSNPSLKDKPMAVGGMSMLSTANYEARKYGVRAAMPGFIARKLCPDLVFVPTDFKKYTHYSDLTRKVFRNYDPNFVAGSLDEAYVDITEVCKERGLSSEEIAEELRSSVYKETGLTCSAGVAPNLLLAKVCSDINKPNGQFVLPNDRRAVMTFISSLPIRKIGGIGKVTEHILRDAFGISTCEQMLQKGSFLCALFSQSSADFFLSVGLGLGTTETPQARSRKSISNERTFSATDDEALIYQKLVDIAENLSSDMQKEGLSGRTLTLKLKTASFEVRTRALTLPKCICSSEDILSNAFKLLKAELPVSLRLIGLRVSHFNEEKFCSPDPTQKSITNFIISGDSSRKNLGEQKFLESDICENQLMETSLSLDSHDCQFRNPMDCTNARDLDDNGGAHCSSDVEVENNHASTSNKDENNVNTLDGVLHTPKSRKRVLEVDTSVLGMPEGTSLETATTSSTFHEGESSDQAEVLLWVDGYKCSVCGTELPPSFIEERQEHFDFHLAERLQKEESGIPSITPVLKQRVVDKASKTKRKKHKPSPKQGANLPIDMFFAKSNQNC